MVVVIWLYHDIMIYESIQKKVKLLCDGISSKLKSKVNETELTNKNYDNLTGLTERIMQGLVVFWAKNKYK